MTGESNREKDKPTPTDMLIRMIAAIDDVWGDEPADMNVLRHLADLGRQSLLDAGRAA